MCTDQYLLHEMRIVARLRNAGLSDEAVLERVRTENLFQYPTTRKLERVAKGCLSRLDAMHDETLAAELATGDSSLARQINLYGIICENRLARDFMVTVVGEKYRTLDMSFGRADVEKFFARLQAQDDNVASWSESTVRKLQEVFRRILVETGFLDSTSAQRLNPVLLNPILENAIRSAGQERLLPAFGCLS